MAYTVIRRYTVDPANVDEIIRRAKEGFVPIISKAPGFRAYRLVRMDDGRAATVSTFDTREQGEESIKLAAGWIKENLGPLLPNPPEILAGEILVRHVNAGVEPKAGVMRVYHGVKDMAEAVRRVESGLVPILTKIDGFASYAVLADGDTAISLSSFTTREAVDRSNREARDWVQANLSGLLPSPAEIATGEIVGGATA